MNRLLALGLALIGITILGGLSPANVHAAQTTAFPSGYERYHTYDEMVADIDGVIADSPGIVAKRSIGQSYQGRTIWAVKISDNVDVDEDEPEVLFESLHHAREHLTVEMALHAIHLLADNYRADPANITSELEQRATDIVNSREVWIVPMLNPDGGEYDLSDPNGFLSWRRNVQPIDGSPYLGVDLNRNWGFKWGCCNGSSRVPGSTTYRGPSRWFAPEVVALRDFVLSRVVDGRQQIRAAISWHTFNEQVMWPFGYTTADLPRTMTADDLAAFRALGTGMAERNGYVAQQMSDLYVLDGAASDWLYGDQRIFAFTVEMYPTDRSHVGGFYPPDGVIERETSRNDGAVLYFLEQADCPYRAAPELALTRCGPLNDDFETGRGWRINTFGTDTATRGAWQRGLPQRTKNAAGIKQLAYGYSGRWALVTGSRAGTRVNANDLDGGSSTALSPIAQLGSAGSTGWTLEFRYSFAHNARATAADYLRVSVNGTEVFLQQGTSANRNGAWTAASVDLDAFAGQEVRVLVEARDAAPDALVEAAIDDLRIYQAP